LNPAEAFFVRLETQDLVEAQKGADL